jgi:hypothetical protein
MELSADWVVGFVDGEGCFHVSINRHLEMTVGFQVLPEFVVVQHQRDRQILMAIKRFFGFGVVRSNHGDRLCYRVRELESLGKVCDFFLQHPLKTKKAVDFLKFRDVVRLITLGRHLAKDGLLEIISIAMEMNTTNRPALVAIKQELSSVG